MLNNKRKRHRLAAFTAAHPFRMTGESNLIGALLEPTGVFVGTGDVDDSTYDVISTYVKGTFCTDDGQHCDAACRNAGRCLA